MKKILVLEDESSIRSFVVINLRRSGYEPIEAASGEEAFEQLRGRGLSCKSVNKVSLAASVVPGYKPRFAFIHDKVYIF